VEIIAVDFSTELRGERPEESFGAAPIAVFEFHVERPHDVGKLRFRDRVEAFLEFGQEPLQ